MLENWSKRQLEERLPLQEALGGLLASILEPTWAHVGAENRLESGSKRMLKRQQILKRFLSDVELLFLHNLRRG